MPKKSSPKRQRNTSAKKAPGNRPQKDMPLLAADSVRGGAKADGSLDAGIHFKYDIRTQNG
jgi:hypothetical protein